MSTSVTQVLERIASMGRFHAMQYLSDRGLLIPGGGASRIQLRLDGKIYHLRSAKKGPGWKVVRETPPKRPPC